MKEGMKITLEWFVENYPDELLDWIRENVCAYSQLEEYRGIKYKLEWDK